MQRTTRSSLVVLSLCLGSAVAAGQRARATREEHAFFAPRYLHELVTSPPNWGVRASGDLDDDGDVDLVMLEQAHSGYNPTGVQTWRNGGQGNLTLAQRFSFAHWDGDNYGGTNIARSVFLADVTGDGRLDLAYERSSDSRAVDQGVLVHAGLGDGTFGGGMLVPVSPMMGQFAVGDCDGDGDADLLVQERNDPASLLTWRSFQGGSFVSGPSLAAGGGLLSTLDVNGDGHADALMTAQFVPKAIQLFLTVDGAPTFGPLVSLPSGIPPNSYRILTGDLEGDGDTDLLTVHWDSSASPNVFYFQPILNDGAGFTLPPLQSVPQPGVLEGGNFLTLEGALADWDADGDLDFVSQGFGWMENTGAAHFAVAAVRKSLTTSLAWNALQVADLDGDGHLDVVADRACTFGDGRFPARSSTTPEPFGPFAFPAWQRLEDWEGDGDLDLVSSTHLYLNNGDGSFAGRATPLPDVQGNQGSVLERAWGDFDGDGFRDVVAALDEYPTGFTGMVLFTGREDGSYQLSPTVPAATEIVGVLTGDLDGNSALDILSLDGFWPNDGSGHFGGGQFGSMIGAYVGRPLLARDLDDDGNLDLLVSHGQGLELLTNLGGLTFQAADLGRYVNSFLPTALDADQDGDLDLVIAQPTNGIVSVREQLPGGGFAAPLELAVPGVSGPVGQIDVDGDGRLELAVGIGSYASRLAVWFREAGLSFSERREWMTIDLPRAFGDLDRDGDVEAIGEKVFQNFRFDGPEDGLAVQYGLDGATSGTGGRHPILGSGGSVRPGPDVKLVIRGGRGGASGVLLRGDGRVDVAAGGIRSFVHAPEVVRSFVLDGTPGAAGAGSIVLRSPVTSALVGLTFDYQVVLVDPGASAGLSATNGLEVRYGDWPVTR